LRVFKEITVLIALPAQHFRGQLRGHFDPRHRSVLGDEANLIDLDGGVSSQRRFQLFGQRRRLGVPAGKCAHESRKTSLVCGGRKVNAGDSR
jgi:hypothetical protein